MFDLFGNLSTFKTDGLYAPYMGGKRKHADKLICMMLERKPGCKYIEGLCHNQLDSYFASLPYLAFMSEYSAPFECVYEIETRSTLSATSNSCAKIDRLYINR